jgi:O-antigen ligase
VRASAAPAGGSAAVWARPLAAFVGIVFLASPVLGFPRSVTFLTYAGLAVVIAGFRFPVLGLLGVALLCTLDAVSRNYVPSSVIWRWNTFNYLLLAATVVLAFKCVSFRNIQSKLLAGLVLVLAIGMISSLSPPDGYQHIRGAVAFWGLLVFCERGGVRGDTWFWAGIVSGVAGATGGFAYFLADPNVQREINKNALSYFPLTAMFVCCLALTYRETSHMRKVILVSLTTISGGWVFLTGSRGSSVIAALCLIFALLQIRSTGLRLAFALVGTVAIAYASTRFESEGGRSAARVQKLFDSSYSLSGRTSGRSDLAIAGWYLFLENPVLGVGTGSFAPKWARLIDLPGLSTYKFGEQQQAHSGWIKTLAENGLPGFVFLGSFVASFAVQGWKRKPDGLFFLGCWITLVLGLAFLSTEFQGKGLWLLAAAGSLRLNDLAGVRERLRIRLSHDG